jgi:hypothetical protein
MKDMGGRMFKFSDKKQGDEPLEIKEEPKTEVEEVKAA